ncbi:MAG: DNA mismatch repair protein MutS [Spirochaetia bacterium]|nr:DNA mismatch repair protein MutS [Spirochaetia bacterium]MCE1210189.1 DNA mismatch repair protein MutS [Spirochaetia bacterium]HOI22014.1 DNA mismatch repair protein MutS [Spirochaetales bacterium]
MAERVSMLDQYRRIKARHRDAILFFRLGDFYEMFFDDAVQASALLDLTLTKRQGQPMCGIPYHAYKPYVARLLKAGKKVAICEQLSQPSSRGIVERDVIEVVTPGTTIEEDFLDQDSNNYIVCACALDGRICVASLDASTGEFRAHSRPDDGAAGEEFLRSELHRLSPRELIIQQSLHDRPGLMTALRELENLMIEKRPDWSFDTKTAADTLARRFGVASLKGFGFSGEDPELAAADILLTYLDENLKVGSPHISSLLPYDSREYVGLDEATRRNLELVKNLSDSGRRDSLLSVLDRTKTAGAARRIRQWILQPLRSKVRIEARLDAVEFLYREQLALNELRRILSGVLDTERLIARLSMDKAHAKDILALRDSLRSSLAALGFLDEKSAPALLRGAAGEDARNDCAQAIDVIDTSIKEDPSILLTEGNLMREGYDAELDRLRAIKQNSNRVLEAYLEEERTASGIQNLRIRYNKIIGYYLEVSKGKLDSVPGHFIRRQSLVTGERYTTDRLAEIESDIHGATEKIVELEKRLFLALREDLKRYIPPMEAIAQAIIQIDCLASFAQAATEGGYARPVLNDGNGLSIRQGRHPVVEACLAPGAFVPNDIELDVETKGFALVTGPNMAGKSTILRQTALICLMAHLGSFVPAEYAAIGLVDKIFCRVGAQDNLARGESTFLVEMHETAYILNTASKHSLVIMDEVGRGTGTLDGVSIAWAVSEMLLDDIGCRTLFATHYHELTSLDHPRMLNLSMAVLENEGEIVFLKQLRSGPAAGSYGLHVAGLAGIPGRVLERARELQGRFVSLEQNLARSKEKLEEGDDTGIIQSAGVGSIAEKSLVARDIWKAELFSAEDMALARIRGANPDGMTPLEALQLLSELHKTLQ